jgi:hypothetical protein
MGNIEENSIPGPADDSPSTSLEIIAYQTGHSNERAWASHSRMTIKTYMNATVSKKRHIQQELFRGGGRRRRA